MTVRGRWSFSDQCRRSCEAPDAERRGRATSNLGQAGNVTRSGGEAQRLSLRELSGRATGKTLSSCEPRTASTSPDARSVSLHRWSTGNNGRRDRAKHRREQDGTGSLISAPRAARARRDRGCRTHRGGGDPRSHRLSWHECCAGSRSSRVDVSFRGGRRAQRGTGGRGTHGFRRGWRKCQWAASGNGSSGARSSWWGARRALNPADCRCGCNSTAVVVTGGYGLRGHHSGSRGPYWNPAFGAVLSTWRQPCAGSSPS